MFEIVAVAQLGILHQIGAVLDHAGCDPLFLKLLHHFFGRSLPGPFLHDLIQLGDMPGTGFLFGKLGGGGKIFTLHDSAELLPLLIGRDGKDTPTVLALTAVASILNPGYLEGIVRGFGGAPLTGATVRATEHGGGASAGTQTGSDGSWSLVVSPGVYDLEATAFGYAPAVETGVMVTSAATGWSH